MPFESKQQERKCFALRARGENGSWDCEEWAHATDQNKLPERDKKANLDAAQPELNQLSPLQQRLLAVAGMGAMGQGIGSILGLAVGRTRGNTPEGLGRGLIRGTATGLGAGLGSMAGDSLGGAMGHPLAGSLAGIGLGGAAGYLGAGHMMGPPESEREEDKYASDKTAGIIQNLVGALERSQFGPRINRALKGTRFDRSLLMQHEPWQSLFPANRTQSPLGLIARSRADNLMHSTNYHLEPTTGNKILSGMLDPVGKSLGVNMTPLRRLGAGLGSLGAVGTGAEMLGRSLAPARPANPTQQPAQPVKSSADLSPGTAARQHVAKKNFAMPASKPEGSSRQEAKGKYPIPDKAHARAAEGFCAMHHGAGSAECRAVRAKVHAKFGVDLGRQVFVAACAEKLASDMAVSPGVVQRLAVVSGVSPEVFVKRAYADPDAFTRALPALVKQAQLADLLGRLRGALGTAGKAVDRRVLQPLTRFTPEALRSTSTRRALTTGGGLAVGGGVLTAGNQYMSPVPEQVPGATEVVQKMHAPAPVRPLSPGTLDASGGGGMATQTAQTARATRLPATAPSGSGTVAPGKAPGPRLRHLLAAGGVGMGLLGVGAAGAALSRRKKQDEEE